MGLLHPRATEPGQQQEDVGEREGQSEGGDNHVGTHDREELPPQIDGEVVAHLHEVRSLCEDLTEE